MATPPPTLGDEEIGIGGLVDEGTATPTAQSKITTTTQPKSDISSETEPLLHQAGSASNGPFTTSSSQKRALTESPSPERASGSAENYGPTPRKKTRFASVSGDSTSTRPLGAGEEAPPLAIFTANPLEETETLRRNAGPEKEDDGHVSQPSLAEADSSRRFKSNLTANSTPSGSKSRTTPRKRTTTFFRPATPRPPPVIPRLPEDDPSEPSEAGDAEIIADPATEPTTSPFPSSAPPIPPSIDLSTPKPTFQTDQPFTSFTPARSNVSDSGLSSSDMEMDGDDQEDELDEPETHWDAGADSTRSHKKQRMRSPLREERGTKRAPRPSSPRLQPEVPVKRARVEETPEAFRSPRKRGTAFKDNAKGKLGGGFREGEAGGFVAGSPSITPYQKQVAKAEKKREEGNTAYAAKDYQFAIDIYTAAVVLYPTPPPPLPSPHPGHTAALANRAAAHMALSNFSAAAADVAQSLKFTILPSLMTTAQRKSLSNRVIRLARCKLAIGQPAEALKALAELLPIKGSLPMAETDPLKPSVDTLKDHAERLEAVINALAMYRDERKWDEVLKWIEVLRTEGPGWGVKEESGEEGVMKGLWLFWKGEAEACLGDVEKAEATVKNVLVMAPRDNPQALWLRTLFSYARGDLELAMQYLASFTTQTPDFRPATELCGRAARFQSFFEQLEWHRKSPQSFGYSMLALCERIMVFSGTTPNERLLRAKIRAIMAEEYLQDTLPRSSYTHQNANSAIGEANIGIRHLGKAPVPTFLLPYLVRYHLVSARAYALLYEGRRSVACFKEGISAWETLGVDVEGLGQEQFKAATDEMQVQERRAAADFGPNYERPQARPKASGPGAPPSENQSGPNPQPKTGQFPWSHTSGSGSSYQNTGGFSRDPPKGFPDGGPKPSPFSQRKHTTSDDFTGRFWNGGAGAPPPKRGPKTSPPPGESYYRRKDTFGAGRGGAGGGPSAQGSDRFSKARMDSKGYYETLELPTHCSLQDIKKAYKKLSLTHHPDKPGGSDEAFQKLGEAYTILSDPQKRRTYDAGAGKSTPFGW